MNRTLEVIADPTEPTIVTRRWVAAPPELVWQCWTRAELLRRWMGPRHLECAYYEVDLRVGGGFRFGHRAPDGQVFGFHGEYREIEAPRRLVGTFVFELFPDAVSVDTLTLEPHEGGTLVTTHSRHSSMEARDAHLASGMEAGMADGYLRLDELLGQPLPTVTPFLWFKVGLSEAVAHYVKTVGGRVLHESRLPDGSVMSCTFELRGQRFVAIGGARVAFTEATSLMVTCADQAEIDQIWAGLLEGGGRESQCGWLVDRWGLSWQVVPAELQSLLMGRDGASAQRTVQAMLGMQKLNIAALRQANLG